MSDKFMFYDNFLYAIEQLPEDEQGQACLELCKFGITGELPKNKYLAMFCLGVQASVQKYQGRGGAREGAGAPKGNKNAEKQEDIKNNQNNQNNQNNHNIQKNQKFQKQQTETETETKTETIIPPLPPKREKIKKLVDDDWQPNEATKSKLQAMGLDVAKVVEKFINSCQAKGLKYIDFNKAILCWDWSKDESLKKTDGDSWDEYWEKLEEKYEQKVS